MSNMEYKSLIRSFDSFINSHRSKTNITHTSLGTPKGSFSFVGMIYQEFMNQYTNIIQYSESHNIDADMYFVERPNSNGVTFLFIDIDFDHIHSMRLYTKNHIKSIIKNINDIVSSNFNVTAYELQSFVMEKPRPSKRPNKDNVYKDGIHIYYPYLPMTEEYRYFVMDNLTRLVQENKLFTDIKYLNDSATIFDTSIVKNNGILMVGSKKEGGVPYKLTSVYDMNLNEINTDEYDTTELIYLLSNQRYDKEATVTIKINNHTDIKSTIDEVYNKYNGGNKPKKEYNTKHNEIPETKSKKNKTPPYTIMNEQDIEIAKQLCPILDVKRASNYRDWIHIGFALYNVHSSLFDTFVTFSKRNISKYNENKVTCEDIWNIAKKYNGSYTIASLRYWACMDNKQEYYKIISKINDKLFARVETTKHVDIANIVYELYKDRYKCVDISKKKWYEFKGHRWENVPSAYTLKELISSDVRAMLLKYCGDKLLELSSNNDDFGGDNKTQKYMKLLKSIDNLADERYRENVVSACASKFFDSKFEEKLNTNEYLIGFDNGVYDLKEMIFRDGLPSDNLTMTVGYDWEEYDINDPVYSKIDKFFSQVQTESDMKEYLLTFIASLLRGIPDTKVHIWTGGGGNGKSATVDIIKNMLGDYYGVVPITLLTRKRGGSSNATPELADKAGKRFIVVQEPEHNDVVFVGQMKEYTGKDTILARPLYNNPFYYIPQFKIVLTCNVLPTIPSTDEGTWRRLRVTPFESEFVDSNPNESKRRFLKDEELQEEFKDWSKALMWLIITKYYPLYTKGINGKRYKIQEPAKVTQFTNNYKKDSDLYMEFMVDIYINTGDKDDKIDIVQIFEVFREWYTTSYSKTPPPKKDFINYLKKNNYEFDKKKQYIYGIKCIHD